MARTHRDHDATLPATDTERRDWLDIQAPVVEAPKALLESQLCPLCRGGKSIKIHASDLPFPVETQGIIWIGCPWCGGAGVVPDSTEWATPDLSERRAE